jgi:hypothetical protein
VTRRDHAVLTGLAVLLVGLGAATPALADGGGLEIDVAGDSRSMGEPPNALVFQGDLMVPGDRMVGQVIVRSDREGELQVLAVDVRSDDNGCEEAEAEDGDTSCGPGQGELDDALVLSVLRDGTLWWRGSLGALETDGLPAETLDADEELVFDWTVELPLATGNLVQGDGVTFDLRFELEGRATEVGGVQVHGSDLPRTGSSTGALLLVGASVGIVGVTFRQLARRWRWT